MNIESLEPQLFDPKEATIDQFEAVNLFENKMRRERWPDDALKGVEETVTRWQSIPPFIRNRAWVVWQGAEIVAMADGGFFDNVDHNQHVMFFSLSVAPEWRRQGIGKILFRRLLAFAQENNKSLLGSQTDTMVPAGEQFAEYIGAEMGLAMKLNQLDLKDLDWQMMRAWQEKAQEQATDYELGVWIGPYPESELNAIVALKETMNTAPRDNLDMEDVKITPDYLRQTEDSLAKRGVERWTLYARHKVTAELAGYTEIYWEAHQPEILNQGDTAVVPTHRNHGLGRWLKAAMIEKIVAEKPQIKRVRTGNAHSNAPMLKINEEMRFYELKTEKMWQMATEKAAAYLQKSVV